MKGTNPIKSRKWLSMMSAGLAVTVAATGVVQASTAQAKASRVQPQVTISFWDVYDTGPSKDLFTKLIQDFEKTHPNIKVDVLPINFWDYWTKLSTAMAAGTGPDLAMNDNNTVPARAAAGAIVDLQPFIKRDHFNVNQFFPVLVNQMKYKGDMYAFPLDTDVRVLYYNKTLFKQAGLDPNKPPKNWKQLEQYSDKLTKYNSNGTLDTVGFSPSLGNFYFWTLAWTNGGEFFDKKGRPTFTSPANVQALIWMANMQKKYGVKAMSAFNAQTGALQYSPFVAGKLAMVVDNNNLYAQIKQYAPNLDFGVAPIPYQKKPASWSNGFSLEILNHKDKAKTEAAWELMKYLVSKKVQLQIAKQLSDLVGNQQAARDPSLMKDPVWRMFVQEMKVSRFRPYIAADPSWFQTLQTQVDAALNGQVDPLTALENAQKQVQTAINNYNATHH